MNKLRVEASSLAFPLHKNISVPSLGEHEGMCSKAEVYHLAHLCLYLCSGKPFPFIPAVVTSDAVADRTIWLVQKSSRTWLASELREIDQDLFKHRVLIHTPVHVGVESSVVVHDELVDSTKNLQGHIIVSVVKPGSPIGPFVHRQASIGPDHDFFLDSVSLQSYSPVYKLLMETARWGLIHFGVNTWQQLLDAALIEAKKQLLATLAPTP